MRFCKTLVLGRPLLLLLLLPLLSCHKPSANPQPTQGIPSTHSLLAHNRLDHIASGFKAAFLKDERARMAFVAMDDPKTVSAAEADFLNPDEYVLGITEGKESRAYPVRFLTFHHVINDTIGTPSRPVAITYCNICNSGIRYDPVVKGKTLKFDFFGVYNGVATLCERQTQGIFLLEEGRIVSGPLSGTLLTPDSLLDTTWAVWKRLHPDTRVMSPQTPFAKYYGSPVQVVQRGEARFPTPSFQESITRGDRRLSPFETVLAVTLPDSDSPRQPLHRAYPLQTLEHAGGVVNDREGSTPVAVLLDARSQTAVALSRRLDARTLTLEARQQSDGTTAFFDRETGTRWDLEGRGETGPLAGKTLPRLDNHLSQWYGWAASFPDTSIYGRHDAPQPGNPFL